ncbi:MAG: type ISP restriction/modification enzyme [bacterium]
MKINPRKILKIYLSHIRSIYATGLGTDETSYYPAFDNLINSVGDFLIPKINSISQLSNKGAGIPDWGWYNVENEDLYGIVEAKPPDTELENVTLSKQTLKYLDKYGVVLLTNYRALQLITGNRSNIVYEENCVLCNSKDELFSSNKFSDKAEGFINTLRSILLRKAPIKTPQDLAERLAHYAQRAKEMLAHHSIEDLQPLRATMKSTLGIEFSPEAGEAFFRSSLIQTIFYGLFSAWVLWLQEKSRDADDIFTFKDVEDHTHLRVINALFTEVTKPYHLKKLNLRPPIEWAECALNRVDKNEFFKTFVDEEAIQYFYEPFLAEYDKDLQKQFGVWLTPPEVVEYIVKRTDYFLREKLKLPLGLADENVVILDPCCGTGSFLVKTIKLIYKRLVETSGALASKKLRKAVRERVIGFELLTAPFVIAHLQIDLLLAKLKATLREDKRAAVYLTNALTGWRQYKEGEEAKLKQTIAFSEFREEREAADEVKQKAKILVVFGNPPYDRYAGVSEEEEGDFIQPYKIELYKRFGIRKQLLDDLYIRFIRLGELVIAEQNVRGLICYISNSSWLSGESHPIMREHLLKNFDELWIDNMHGSGAYSGSRGPDGLPDRSIFEHSLGSIGIKVGVAITTLLKTSDSTKISNVLHQDFWGQGCQKREALEERAKKNDFVKKYRAIIPSAENSWKLIPQIACAEYASWRSLIDIFSTYYSGVNTNRGDSISHIDRDVLIDRMKRYYDGTKTDDEIAEICPDIMKSAAGYDPVKVRAILNSKKTYSEKNISTFSFKPLDNWYLYYEDECKLINRRRPRYFEQIWHGNQFLLTYKKNNHAGVWDQMYVTPHLAELQVTFNSSPFPLYTRREEFGKYIYKPNIRRDFLEQLCARWKIKYIYETDTLQTKPDCFNIAEELFYHTVAILQSPQYRKENHDLLNQKWPRIPIPKTRKLLGFSAEVGKQVAILMQPDERIKEVTEYPYYEHFRNLAIPSSTGGGELNTQVTVPYWAKGKWIQSSEKPAKKITGDLYWNETCFWKNVPKNIYEFSIGGYPIIKKWLSYRHKNKLKRSLTIKEIEYVTEMTRRIAAMIELGIKLDLNYQKVKGAAFDG